MIEDNMIEDSSPIVIVLFIIIAIIGGCVIVYNYNTSEPTQTDKTYQFEVRLTNGSIINCDYKVPHEQPQFTYCSDNLTHYDVNAFREVNG